MIITELRPGPVKWLVVVWPFWAEQWGRLFEIVANIAKLPEARLMQRGNLPAASRSDIDVGVAMQHTGFRRLSANPSTGTHTAQQS